MHPRIPQLSRLSLAIAIASGVAVAPQALAQGSSANALEEIVVTARKREENVQDLGISVTALSQTEIERTFARDLKDLASMAPNLVIDDTSQGPGGVAAIYIRGVGVADVEKSFDPAVGVVIDQVFIGANTGSILKSLDVARIEVLRGPQGTLFGRNTIGGVINVERTKPTGEFGGKIRAGYGDYDSYNVEGLLNFPITDTLAAKLTGTKREQQEGYYDNVVTGDDDGQEDYQQVGVNLLFSPSDAIELEYTYNYENTDQDTPPLLNNGQPRHLFCSAFGYCAPSEDSTITGDRYKVARNAIRPPKFYDAQTNITTPDDLIETDFDANFNTDTHIVELRWDLNDDYRFDAIYGHWNSSETVFTDWDGTPDMLYHTDRPGNWEQDSLELRITNGGDDAFSWVAGAFFWKSSFDIKLRSYIGFAVPGLILDIPQFGEQDTDSTALFFEGDYAFNDKWTLTLGGRYTEDEKTSAARGGVDTSIPVPGGSDGDPSDEWDEFTPKVGLQYQINDDAMVYATYSEGYRSGGFNTRVGSYSEAITPYNQETVTNYELGFKSEWFDRTLRLNAAVFLMEYDDKQEELHLPDTLSGTGQKTVVANASTAEMKGFEVELQAYPADGLTIRANVGYLDAAYDEFQFYDALLQAEVDYSDLDFRRAPEWTGNLDATYEWDVGANQMWARVAIHYLGEHETNFDNSPELHNDSQNLVDASINYEMGGTRLSLFGRNLTDEDGYMIGYDVASIWSYSAARPPRTWGIEITHEFGAN
jgi:iron complex outermembrane recepter protein